MFRHLLLASVALSWSVPGAMAQAPQPTIRPLVRVVDMPLGGSADIELCDGSQVRVKLLDLRETRDSVRDAVRKSEVTVEINGQVVHLTSANYELPQTVGSVRVDCPITKGLVENSKGNAWGLLADVRLRFWPAEGPLLVADTFVYPVKQRWFANDTQMANEPCYVNACEKPSVRDIYYHYGLDFGGAEGLVEVVAATDGLVVSAREEKLGGFEDTPVATRYDVVYVLDARGWYYRYSHFHSIDETIQPGVRVKAGQPLGRIGKEGGSGGWTHLHFDITCRQPSGEWGCQEAYAFAWNAYQREYAPTLLAVARPHHLIFAGETVSLDAGRCWSSSGPIKRYEWTFTDGATAEGPRVDRTYSQPGYYSEVLKVTDGEGNIDYDFAIVHVIDRQQPEPIPPAIHPVYYPTFGIAPGDEVTFKVRTFGTTAGQETWDFGDGSDSARSQSDGNVDSHAENGYAVVTHRYAKSGHYLVRVERTDDQGRRAVGHLQVRVRE